MLCITLDNSSISSNDQPNASGEDSPNLFLNYLSRIHRDDVRNGVQKKRINGKNAFFLCSGF